MYLYLHFANVIRSKHVQIFPRGTRPFVFLQIKGGRAGGKERMDQIICELSQQCLICLMITLDLEICLKVTVPLVNMVAT